MKIILTGHTRGLGAALAKHLLARQFSVLGIARQSNTELAARFPATLHQVQLDLSDSTALVRWLDSDKLRHFVASSDSVALINNAGMLQPIGPLDAHDAGDVARAVSLNVAAPLMLAAAMTTASDNAGDRRIVHISSGAGSNAYPGWSVYCATKAALDHHARSAALDQTANLRICSLAPGVIDTDVQAEIRASTLQRFPLRERFDALKRDGNLADPDQCAQRVVDFLLSDKFGQEPVADLREISA